MQIEDSIQEFKHRFNDLINNLSLSPILKKKYLISIENQVGFEILLKNHPKTDS